MCGIGFILGGSPAAQSTLESCLAALRRRGPDDASDIVLDVETGEVLHLLAAVLHLRGKHLHPQPAEDSNGNVLLWNGEVFDGLEVGPSESDTGKVLQALSGTRSHEEVVETLARISGPFSFVFWCLSRRELYYGRDAVGRRSLVARRPRTPQEPLIVMSCLPRRPVLAGGCSSNPAAMSAPAGAHGIAETGSPQPSIGVPFCGIDDGAKGCWEEVSASGVYSLSLGLSLPGGRSPGGEWNAPSLKLHAWPASCVIGEGDGGSTTDSSTGDGHPAGVSDGINPGERGDGASQIPSLSPSPSSSSSSISLSSTSLTTSGSRGCTTVGLVDEGQSIQPVCRDCMGPPTVEGNRQGPEDWWRGERGGKTPPREASAGCNEDEILGKSSRGMAERGRMSPAAVGLLGRLRDSIDRRVRSVPRPEACSWVEGMHISGAGDTCLAAESNVVPGRSQRGEGTEARDATLAGASGPDGGGRIQSDGQWCIAEKCNVGSPARVGVLFSGGLDSVVLAALLAEAGGREDRGAPVPRGEPIDLINVCFDSPTGHTSPDRLASMVAVGELRTLFPGHAWRLVCVNASYEDVVREGSDVWRVMQPCDTTMDFNIAAAFYFASRGKGWLYQSPPQPPQLPLTPSDPRSEGPTLVPLSTQLDLETPTGPASDTERTDIHIHGVESQGKLNGDKKETRKSVLESDRRGGKVNKNLERLCPVGGCRRLLKPGCAFDVCSRCCLKAQGLLDAAVSAPRPPPPRTMTSTTSLLEAASDGGYGGDDAEEAPTDESTSERRQRLYKARALAEALRALEVHLATHFVELSTPFQAGELASLLERDIESSRRRVRAERSQHLCLLALESRPARGGNAAAIAERLSTKWCPAHKKLRSRGAQGDDCSHATSAWESAEAGAEQKPRGRSAAQATYTSKARVLLVGIGADEFMGGYSRHRNVYRRGGPAALSSELQKDQARLWRRNLGRDDRCIADHGKEARFPYLDEGVVSYIRSLPLQKVCNMDEPPGVGDKKVLREVAEHLGLKSCRSLPKRAIQFGTRIAQHCARHTHGSHRRGSGTEPAAVFES